MFKLGDVISPTGTYLTINTIVEPWMRLVVAQVGSNGIMAEFLGDERGFMDEFIDHRSMHFYRLDSEFAFYKELEAL